MNEPLEETVLRRGLADYTGLWELPRIVRRTQPNLSSAEIRGVILESVRSLAEQDLVEIGDLVRISSTEPLVDFFPWATTVEQSIQRIEAEWENIPGELQVGAIAWLHNTPRGDIVGEALSPYSDQ